VRPSDWVDFIDHLEEDHAESLSPWEQEFLDSVREQAVNKRSISPKQETVLKRIKLRCQCGDQPYA
jgi:hypothetical protein